MSGEMWAVDCGTEEEGCVGSGVEGGFVRLPQQNCCAAVACY